MEIRFLRRRVRRKKHFARKNILETSKKTNAARVRAALAFSPPFKCTRDSQEKKWDGICERKNTIFSCRGFVNHAYISTADGIASSISTADIKQEGTAGDGAEKSPRRGAAALWAGTRRGERGTAAGRARKGGPPSRTAPPPAGRKQGQGPQGRSGARRATAPGGTLCGGPARSAGAGAAGHAHAPAGPRAQKPQGGRAPRSDGGAHNRRAARRGGLYARTYR